MTDTPRRLPPDDRRQHVLQAAVQLALDEGYLSLTLTSVAAAAGISPGLVLHYYYATQLLREAVMQHAVEQGLLSIVAEGLAARSPAALAAPAEMRQAAVAGLAGD